MVYCEQCGKKVSDTSKFCMHCGTNRKVLASESTTELSAKEKKVETSSKETVKDNKWVWWYGWDYLNPFSPKDIVI